MTDKTPHQKIEDGLVTLGWNTLDDGTVTCTTGGIARPASKARIVDRNGAVLAEADARDLIQLAERFRPMLRRGTARLEGVR